MWWTNVKKCPIDTTVNYNSQKSGILEVLVANQVELKEKNCHYLEK